MGLIITNELIFKNMPPLGALNMSYLIRFCYLSNMRDISNGLLVCAPLAADLFLFCYERDFMASLSDDKQADIIDAFNTTSRY